MEQSRFRRDEIEVQHFEFSSTQFIDQFKQLATKDIKAVLDAIKNKYLNKEEQEEKEILNSELEKLQLMLTKQANNKISQFEPEIRKFFAVPENVASKLDLMSQYPVPDITTEELEKELDVLEKNYMKEKTFNQLCEKQLSDLLEVEPHYEHVNTILQQKNFNLDMPSNQKLNDTLELYDELMQSCFNGVQEMPTDYVKHYKSFVKHNNR